jgi:hypothetical protein
VTDPSNDEHPADTVAPPVRSDELFGAFARTYDRIRASGALLLSANVNVHALMELLVAKGVITPEELESYRGRLAAQIKDEHVARNLGVVIDEVQTSKYDIPAEELPQIDCAERLPLCKAACCRLRWALGEEDLEEGVVQWELRRPYLNRVEEPDGWCVHCHPETKACGIYEQRPRVCRTYDCRNDDRIWVDFEQRIINPDLHATPELGAMDESSR